MKMAGFGQEHIMGKTVNKVRVSPFGFFAFCLFRLVKVMGN